MPAAGGDDLGRHLAEATRASDHERMLVGEFPGRDDSCRGYEADLLRRRWSEEGVDRPRQASPGDGDPDCGNARVDPVDGKDQVPGRRLRQEPDVERGKQ